MKRHYPYGLALLTVFSVSVGLLATIAAEDDKTVMVETRTYILGGYIPKLHETDEAPTLQDPFDDQEMAAHDKKIREYEKSIVTYLKQYGIEARKVEFKPGLNALFITDTSENFAVHEMLLRNLFRPDMQLRAIEGATRALADRKILDGDKLSRISLLDDITFRAFHNEVRKLDSQLESLPEGHQERAVIIERRRIAKEYREEAIKLYLKSLEEQRALIARWQKTTKRTK